MNALSAAIARSGSAGASSSTGGTPLASSHKSYRHLEHTPGTVSRAGNDLHSSSTPAEVALNPLSAATAAATSAEAAAEAVSEVSCAPAYNALLDIRFSLKMHACMTAGSLSARLFNTPSMCEITAALQCTW